MNINIKTVSSIISSTIAMHNIEQLKHTPFYNGPEKFALNSLIKKLSNKERIFNDIDEVSPEALNALYDTHYDYIQEVSDVKIHELGELIQVIQHFKKDKKSLLDIVGILK